jgi:hypothetical protein
MNIRKCIATSKFIICDKERNQKKGIKRERRKKNGAVQNFGHTLTLGQEIMFGILPC